MLVAKRNSSMIPTMFNELLNWDNWNNLMNAERNTMPKTNISESKDDYQMELCVPGLKKEDLSIKIDNENNLVIEMVRKEEKKDEQEERNYLRREFSEMCFRQTYSLPDEVKRDQISAKVENGVLTVTMPKMTEDERKGQSQVIEIA